MIYIKKDTDSAITIELEKLHNLSNPTYLFVFFNLTDNSYIYFTTDDLSTANTRYNLFKLTDDSSINKVDDNTSIFFKNTAINLSITQYDFDVYVSDSSIDNLSDAQSIVDNNTKIYTGKMVVDGESTATNLDSIYQ